MSLAVVGAAGLLFGGIASFATANGPGAFALVLAGLVLVVAAITLPALTGRLRLGGHRATGSETVALAGLLTAPDPQVRLAAAEAVLDPAEADPNASTPDLKELALGVLLDRDLVRRVSDLLTRGGYSVVSDAVGSGAHHPAADVLVSVGQDAALPVTVNTGSGRDTIGVVQSLSAVAGGLSARAAVVIFTGPQNGAPPLGTATSVGGVQVFSVYSPRLGDEPSVLAAVGQAVEAAGSSGSAASPTSGDPVRNGAARSPISEPSGQH